VRSGSTRRASGRTGRSATLATGPHQDRQHSGSIRRRRPRTDSPGCKSGACSPSRVATDPAPLCGDVRADWLPSTSTTMNAAPARRTAGAARDRPPSGLRRAGGSTAPGQKAPVDCAALVEDLFIDLKEVVKAGCMPSEKQIAKLLGQTGGQLRGPAGAGRRRPSQSPPGRRYRGALQVPIHPDLPISLGPSDWNLINRVVFPIYSAPLNKGFGDLVGLAPDAILSNRASPASWPTL